MYITCFAIEIKICDANLLPSVGSFILIYNKKRSMIGIHVLVPRSFQQGLQSASSAVQYTHVNIWPVVKVCRLAVLTCYRIRRVCEVVGR